MVVDDSPIHLDGLDDSHRSLFFDQLLPAVDGVDPMGGVCRYWDECGKFWCLPTHSAVARPIAGPALSFDGAACTLHANAG